uniref:PAZ domain-containing protein n=1 Tax=Plectus sambesii TaxID=2011161 RepID=A0A914X5E6_9BILA
MSFSSSPNTAALSQQGSVVKAKDLLDFVFVTRPASGCKEGEEHKKLMYFWPKKETVDYQVQTIGFAEAVVKFTVSFAAGDEQPVSSDDDSSFRHVNTAKQLHIYFEVENDEYLLGFGLNRARAAENGYSLHASSLRTVLNTAYKMFRLFFGSFSKLFASDETGEGTALKDRLDYFFTRYLGTLRLQQMPIIDLYSGVDFMSLDNINFLKIETLIAQVCEVFPQVKRVMFLYQDRLLWYTVPKADVVVLYRYLTQNLLPMSLRAELQPETQKRSTNPHHHGKFITGPPHMDSSSLLSSMSDVSSKEQQLPVVHLSDDNGDLVPYHLIVYRALNATICLFAPVDEHEVTSEFFRNLDALLGPRLTAVASMVGDSFIANSTNNSALLKKDIDFHYVYYNPSSLSLKTTFGDSAVDTAKIPLVPSAIYRLVCDLADELETGEHFGDVLAKTDGDWWVAAKKANDRVLFLIFPQRSSGLTEVHDEVRRFTKNHFEGIFFNE